MKRSLPVYFTLTTIINPINAGRETFRPPFGLLIVASILLSFEKSRKHNGFHIGFVWAMIAGLFFSLPNLEY